MATNQPYSIDQPARAEVDSLSGPTVIEFGTDWCGYCRGAQPLISAAFREFPAVRHLKVEDGPGRPLGRSFRVKLWPTLVFVRQGQELARVVRPVDEDEIRDALRALSAA